MSHTDVGVRVAGMWLAIASIIQAMSFLFHGPISSDFGNQMNRIADGSLRWSIIHWAAAAALAFFAVASLIMLTTGSRLTQEWWTLSSWALVPVGALWTVNTAVAEATVIFNAAATGNREIYESWWMFAEGGANGFAAMALAFTGNEARVSHRVTPHWAALIAAVAGAASLLGWCSAAGCVCRLARRFGSWGQSSPPFGWSGLACPWRGLRPAGQASVGRHP